jgi:hypothetical protein
MENRDGMKVTCERVNTIRNSLLHLSRWTSLLLGQVTPSQSWSRSSFAAAAPKRTVPTLVLFKGSSSCIAHAKHSGPGPFLVFFLPKEKKHKQKKKYGSATAAHTAQHLHYLTTKEKEQVCRWKRKGGSNGCQIVGPVIVSFSAALAEIFDLCVCVCACVRVCVCICV